MSINQAPRVPALLDHIVIAGPYLDALVEWFAERTGVTAAPGGEHPTGTANALVALTISGNRGPHYIELIGPNPRIEHATPPSTFGINTLNAPTIVTYAIHPEDIDDVAARARENGVNLGPVSDLSRQRPDGTLLEWRLTANNPNTAVPFLIDWGGTEHPGVSDIPTLELVSFERVEPDPEPQRRSHEAFGLPEGSLADIARGDQPDFRLTVRRADGEIVVL
ncbi:MAG: VOC family protein [Ancrocorticia sp.]